MNNVSSTDEYVEISSCDLCRGREWDTILTIDPWTLVKCSSCGLVMTNPRYSESALQSLYENQYYQIAHDYCAIQVKPPLHDHYLVARYAHSLVKGQHVIKSLDIGCGGGQLVEAFSSIGFDAAGIEPNKNIVEMAAKAGRNISSMELKDAADEAFICVTAFHVLEHVPSPTEFLEQVHRILAPGGICIIEVPDISSKSAKRLGSQWHALHPGTHLYHFTPESLSQVLKKTGFEVKKLKRRGGAGIFNSVVQKENVKASNPATGEKKGSYIMQQIWKRRAAILKIPLLRRFVRWVNWELLSNGEYVQAIVRKQ